MSLSTSEQIFVAFFARGAQLAGAVAVLFGAAQALPFIEQFQLWQQAKGNDAALCLAIVRVTAPIVLGVLLIAAIEFAMYRHRTLSRALAEHPNEPWLANLQWAAKSIRLSHRPLVIGVLIAVMIYTSILLPLAFGLDWKPLRWIVGGVGVLFLLFLFSTWKTRHWRSAELRLGTLPGVLGGPFSAVFLLPRSSPADTVFEVSLRCTHVVKYGKGKNSRVERRTLWGETLEIDKQLGGPIPGTTAVPMSFAIPLECPPSMLLAEQDAQYRDVQWILKVQIKDRPGQGMSTFTVPVYKTAGSRAHFQLADSPVERFEREVDPEHVLRRTGFHCTSLPDGTLRIDLHRREVKLLLAMLVVGGLSAGAIFACFRFIQMWELKLFLSLFPAIFVFGTCYVVLEFFFWHATIIAGEQQLKINAGLLGFRKRRTLPRDHATQIVCDVRSRGEVSEFVDLYLCGDGNEKIQLFRGLEGRNEAEAVQQWLAEKLGVSVRRMTAKDGFEN